MSPRATGAVGLDVAVIGSCGAFLAVTATVICSPSSSAVAVGYSYTPTAAQAGTQTSVIVAGEKNGYATAVKTLKRFGHVRP